MKYIKLGNTDIYVSQIGMGVLTMGRTQLNLTVEEGASIIKHAVSSGINFFDTAQYYETYPYIRCAMENMADKPVICSKCLGWSYSDMEYAINEALQELNTDFIDIFLMHEVRPGDIRTGAWQCLKDYKNKKKVKAIGISTHHVDVMEEYMNYDDIDVMFPLINLESMGIRKGDNPASKEEMENVIYKASQKGIGIFAMKAFGGGPLIHRYQEALDYVFNVDGISSVMLGFGNIEEVNRAIEYIDGRLPENYTPDTSNKKIYVEPGNCEGCGNCVSRCPNSAIKITSDGIANVDGSKCLTCGYCAPVCPVRALIYIG